MANTGEGKALIPFLVAHSLRGSIELSLLLQCVEREYLIQVLVSYDYNKTKTCKKLGMHRNSLDRRLKAMGIVIPRRIKC